MNFLNVILGTNNFITVLSTSSVFLTFVPMLMSFIIKGDEEDSINKQLNIKERNYKRKMRLVTCTVFTLSMCIGIGAQFLTEVPDVIGFRFEKAKDRLENAGLEISPQYAGSDRLVVEQSISEGIAIKGTIIELKLEGEYFQDVNGVEIERMEIPDVILKMEYDALYNLYNLGFDNVQVEYKEDNTIMTGYVLDIIPEIGEMVELDTAITIYVSKNPFED